MKFLTAEEFFGPSVNTVKTGMSLEAEKQRKQECIKFISQLNSSAGFKDTKCECIAISIFCLYTRKVPFSHFERFMAAALSYYIAAKIIYQKPEIHYFEKYVHERAPLPSASMAATTPNEERPPFEGKVRDQLHKAAVELELNMLAVLQYDFEFEFPFTYVKQYFSLM